VPLKKPTLVGARDYYDLVCVERLHWKSSRIEADASEQMSAAHETPRVRALANVSVTAD
jgi:hypothetical protein